MLNPHLLQVLAVSGFFVPQFGQNKTASQGRLKARANEMSPYPSYTQGAAVPSVALQIWAARTVSTRRGGIGSRRGDPLIEKGTAEARTLDTVPAGQLGFARVATGHRPFLARQSAH